jgi:hypothetical protein
MNIEFTKNKIDKELYKKMVGKSIPTEYINVVNVDNYSYLKVAHYGFDDKIHLGELIVANEVADDVINIFKELYDIRYKIEKIKLIDEYNGDDNLSMADNNSSGFNYRKIPFKETLSNHAKGIAIDINPLYNPYIVDGKVLPGNGKDYVDRTIDDERFIKKGDKIYNIFIKYGWSWGGEWTHAKDYQHFEKI